MLGPVFGVHVLGTPSLDMGLLYFGHCYLRVLMCPVDDGGCSNMVRYRVTLFIPTTCLVSCSGRLMLRCAGVMSDVYRKSGNFHSKKFSYLLKTMKIKNMKNFQHT